MAAIDFPSSPGVGQTFTSGGTTWIYDGVKWTSTSAATGIYLPLTGGTMTGDLILNRDAVAPLQAATYEQVQARGAGDNRVINGDMRIDQRNNGASGTANATYTVDRWRYSCTQATKGTWQRYSGPSLIPFGFSNAWSFVSSSAYTPLATDSFTVYQPIEADTVSDFAWGTANAQPVTLSCLIFSSLTGTFGGSIRNDTNGRSCPFAFSVPVAGVWTKCAVTIPGDTAGTWVMSGNAAALNVTFDLGSGANFRAPAGAWANGNYTGANGSVSVVATNGASFYLTGVKLEIGSVATPFNRQSLAKSMADCQRYYQKVGGNGSVDLTVAGYAAALGNTVSCAAGIAAMRSSPTATIVGTFTQVGPIGSVSLLPGLQTLAIQLTSNAVGFMNWYNSAGAASVTLNAEL